MKCVLLSGGGGTRLWPLSSKERPKQYLKLPQGGSLFSEALERNAPLVDGFLIVTNTRYEELTYEELSSGVGGVSMRMVLEPIPRNTAPAVAMAALLSDADEVLLMVPTDHRIEGMESYAAAVQQAERMAQEGSIVVFGVEPTSPHTGYGYIKYRGNEVLAFKEKPDRETAERYLAQGGYLWNSGMLAFRADVMLEELRVHCPDILQACEHVANAACGTGDVLHLDEELFSQVRAESIDYAVLEQSQRVHVVPAGFAWSDLGSLEAFGFLAEADECGNRVLGERVVVHACEGSRIYNASNHMQVVANGLEDIIVAVTDEAVYVTKCDKADEIRDLDRWVERRP